jgi:trimethylamine-N-oxide reductase (cytochrome c)
VLIDGHRYWIMRLNTKDAAVRASGRTTSSGPSTTAGRSSCGADTERVPSGTVHSYESCADYLPSGSRARLPTGPVA